MDYVVRSLTVAIPLLLAWQVLGKKSHPEHDNRGAVVGIATLILFVFVLSRGSGSEAAGPLYNAHLALSAPYFALIPVILWTGMKMRHGFRPRFWKRIHFGAVIGAGISFLVSVGFGIGSYLESHRILF